MDREQGKSTEYRSAVEAMLRQNLKEEELAKAYTAKRGHDLDDAMELIYECVQQLERKGYLSILKIPPDTPRLRGVVTFIVNMLGVEEVHFGNTGYEISNKGEVFCRWFPDLGVACYVRDDRRRVRWMPLEERHVWQFLHHHLVEARKRQLLREKVCMLDYGDLT